MISEHTFFAFFRDAFSFADREKMLIQQIQQESRKLEIKGYRVLKHQINTRSDAKASVTIFYQK